MTKTRKIAYTEFRDFLQLLGFEEYRIDRGIRAIVFKRSEHERLFFRIYKDKEVVHPKDLYATRTFLDYWGLIDPADFDAQLLQPATRGTRMTDIRPPSQLYKFAGEPSRLLFTGTLPEKGSIIVGPIAPAILVLRFDEAGALRDVETVRDASAVDQASFDAAVGRCFRQRGAVPGPIRIRRFDSSEPGSPLGALDAAFGCPFQLTDLPFDLSFSEGEPEETRLAQEEWLASGCYVLTWGNDYYVNGKGRIFST